MTKKKILIIIGSLRKESFNRQLAQKAVEIIGNQADVSFLDYADLPYMNQDIEYPAPEAVGRVREQVMAADGIWIFTPEYNYNLPGVLKNLLDWLSRPLEAGNWDHTAVFGKAVTFSGAGGQSATAQVRRHLLSLLQFIKMEVMEEPSTGIALTMEEFQTSQLLLSDENKSALEKQFVAFMAFINK